MDSQPSEQARPKSLLIGMLVLPVVLLISYGLAILSFNNDKIITYCYVNLSYYIISLMIFLAVYITYIFIRRHKDDLAPYFRQTKLGLLMAALLTILVCTTVAPTLRVLNDEANLVSVANSMSSFKKPLVLGEAVSFYGKLYPLNTFPDKRPLLFPWLVSALNTVRGYQLSNVYLVNYACLLALLYLVFVWVRNCFGTIPAIAAQIAVVAQPIVSLSASSGGYDLIACLFMFLAAAAMWFYIRHRSDTSLLMMCMVFLLLAHIRPESMFYAMIAIPLMLLLRLVRLRDLIRWRYAFLVLFIVPQIWQRWMSRNDPQLPTDTPIFSIGHFIDNNAVFLKSLVRFDFHLPYDQILLLLGIAAALFLGVRMIMRRKEMRPATIRFTIVWTVVFVLTWLLITSWFWANCQDAVCARYYLFVCVLGSVLTCCGLAAFKPVGKKPLIVLMVAVFCLLLYHPTAIENRFFAGRRGYARDYRIALEYLHKLNPVDTIIVSESPRRWILHGFGAIGFNTANGDSSSQLARLSNRLYRAMYVVQQIDRASDNPSPGYIISPAYRLKTVFEGQNRGGALIRVSKVVNSD